MIGVVDEDGQDESGAGGLDAVESSVTRRPADELARIDLEAVVARSESAIAAAVRAGIDVPILPVNLEAFPSVSPSECARSISEFLAGHADTSSHPLVSVSREGNVLGRACFDVMLVRSEPGRISEYSLAADEARSRFRADGVVVATPAGSGGYASAAGGPRLEADASVVSVVPVAAFGLGAPTWIVNASERIELQVVRDEGDVSLLLDGVECDRITGRGRIQLELDGELETIIPVG